MIDETKYKKVIDKVKAKYNLDYHHHVDVDLTEDDKRNKDLAKYLMAICPKALELFDPQIINDKELLMQAVAYSGSFLVHADEKSKSDAEIVLTALKNIEDGSMCPLEYASNSLKDNQQFIREAVKANGASVLSWLKNSNLEDDRELIREAVKNDPNTLKYVSDGLKGDKEIVLRAIRKDPMLIQYASEELKNDINIALEAVSRNPESYEFVGDSARKDIEVAKEAVSGNPDMLRLAPKTDEVILEAMTVNPQILEYGYNCVNRYGISLEDRDRITKKFNKLVKKGKIIPASEENYGPFGKNKFVDIDYDVEPDLDISYEVDEENAKEEQIDVDYDITDEEVPEEDNIIFEKR